MERKAYLTLRSKLFKIAGEVGTLAESQDERSMLAVTYRRLSDALDAITMLGEELGYIDIETGNVIDRRFKKNQDDMAGIDRLELSK